MTKQTKTDTHAPSGRIAFNDRGDAVWEWRTDTGTFKADINTQQVKALQESADVTLGDGKAAAPAPAQRPDNNPYSTLDTLHTLSQKKPRRTLDDMRKLSEEIKKARAEKKIF
jgi:hypothetical protein